MIKITDSEKTGLNTDTFNYVKGRKGIAQVVLPVTRFLRAVNAEKYIEPGNRILDIGCGDGYFLLRSKCKERYGIDKILGDKMIMPLGFPDNYFNYVTMLAVIEHIEEPEPLLKDIYRMLKPGGKLIITTPVKNAELFIRLYVKNISKEHHLYYNTKKIKNLMGDYFYLSGKHRFLFGLNQVFCFGKKDN